MDHDIGASLSAEPAVRVRRAGRQEVAARHRARTIAVRMGTALRGARLAAGLEQAEVGRRSGLSQVHISRLERGAGDGASLRTWSRVASAVGEQLVAFLELTPGADQPRDFQHLMRQDALIKFATPGGWQSLPEFAVDSGTTRSRSVDVALIRVTSGEAIVAEIWDWFDDVGAGLRSLDGKVDAMRQRLAHRPSPNGSAWNVQGLYVVRDTRRNRALIGQLGGLFGARFRASSYRWLEALGDPSRKLPAGHGLLWSDRTGLTLRASRLPR
jgi:transcriptional regulator with XRE-family HTH domain